MNRIDAQNILNGKNEIDRLEKLIKDLEKEKEDILNNDRVEGAITRVGNIDKEILGHQRQINCNEVFISLDGKE